jgi:hypothetical protein
MIMSSVGKERRVGNYGVPYELFLIGVPVGVPVGEPLRFLIRNAAFHPQT